MQRIPRIPFFLFAFALSMLSAAEPAAGQSQNRNNPYSPSPVTKTRANQVAVVETPVSQAVVGVSTASDQPAVIESKTTDVPVRKPVVSNAKPFEIYRIGAGDVLFIDLKNASNGSGYFTVAADGTINYPLVGENVIVAGQTSDDVATMLADAITLYKDAAVQVKVREWNSHRISVSGLVEQIGERTIQRDAVPLYVIRADAGVDPRATSVNIRHANGANETLYLRDTKSDETLIFPGDVIEFSGTSGAKVASSGVFYISGDVVQIGQHDLIPGMTLMQAVTASGGSRGNPKKAFLRRKGDKGNLNVTEFNLRSIKNGRSTDPAINPGDMIEIAN